MSSNNDFILARGGRAKETIEIDYTCLRKLILILRSINHELRQEIIKMLEDGKKLTVTEIFVKLRVEQSMASQHLAILRKAGILRTERTGKYIYYALNKERLKDLSALATRLLSC